MRPGDEARRPGPGCTHLTASITHLEVTTMATVEADCRFRSVANILKAADDGRVRVADIVEPLRRLSESGSRWAARAVEYLEPAG
jgi:hypothetical protein